MMTTTPTYKTMGSCQYDLTRTVSPAVQTVVPSPVAIKHIYTSSIPTTNIHTTTDTSNRKRPMDIDEFLAAHGIASVPVRVTTFESLDGVIKKRFVSLKNDLGLDFKYGQNLFNGDRENQIHLRRVQQAFSERRQMLVRRYGQTLRGAMDTSKIFIIDVDDRELEQSPIVQDLMGSSPYYRSVSKNLPKIFIKIDGELVPTKNIPLVKGQTRGDSPRIELQKGQWSFYNYGQNVENVDYGIRSLTVAEMRDMFPDMPSADEMDVVPRPSRPRDPTPNDRPLADNLENDGRECPIDINQFSLGVLVSLLKPTRADNRRDWLSVGYALKMYLELEEAWEIFKEFSEQSPKFRPNEDRYTFDRLVPSGIANINTLRKMAFYDNAERYVSAFPEDTVAVREFHIQKLGVKKNTAISHGAIANIFTLTEDAEMYRYCALSRTWFSVSDTDIWVKHAEPITDKIRTFTSALVSSKFQGELDEKDMKVLGRLSTASQSKSFVEGCIYFLKAKLLYDNFLDKMDTNGRIIAFADCVYDLELQGYRATEPTDYIMTTVGYNRPDPEMSIQEELTAFMKSLFESEEKTMYLMRVLASSLFEGNKQQEFYVLTGSGSNGKSLLMTLLSKALGAYNGDMSYAALTSRRKAENAFSDWVKTRPMRFVKCLEPDAKSMIQGNMVKKITGGDAMTERELHRNTQTWRPLFVFYLIANEVPRFDHIDEAVERRLRFIHFPFQFKDKEKLGEAWQDDIHRQRDEGLMDKFEQDIRYGQQFLLMLIDVYNRDFLNKDHSAVLSSIPDDFYKIQMEYQRSNNVVATYITERYEILEATPENKKDHSKDVESLYKDYRAWAMGQYIRSTDKNMTQHQFACNLNGVPDIAKSKWRPSAFEYTLRPKESRLLGNCGSYAPGFEPNI